VLGQAVSKAGGELGQVVDVNPTLTPQRHRGQAPASHQPLHRPAAHAQPAGHLVVVERDHGRSVSQGVVGVDGCPALAGYERLYRRNIASRLGSRQLRALRPETVRMWHAQVTAAAGADQAAKSYRLLRAVLATAEADELIRQNPCRIRGGGQENAEERPMVPTSLVLELVDAIDPRYRAMILLAGFAGLRTGEALGLRRCDVDLLHAEVHVRHQAQEIAGSGRVVLGPKSEAGRRSVAHPGLVVEALEQQLATGADADPEAPLFTGPEGGPLRRATFSRAWRAAVTVTGAPGELGRMTYATMRPPSRLARMPGITTKELMARIGHASPRAALIYQHATRERDRAVASYLDDVVAASTPASKADVVDLTSATGGAVVGLGS